MQIMFEQGYNATGVKDIVDAASVPKGSFYNYFESKESFVIEALERVAACKHEEMRRGVLNGESNVLDNYLRFFEDRVNCAVEANCYSGCFLGNICQEMADCCEPIRLKVKALFDQQVQLLAEIVVAGQADGSINKELDPTEMAEYLFSSWEGAMLKMKADKTSRAFNIFLVHSRILLSP